MHNHTLTYASRELAEHAKGIIAYLGITMIDPHIEETAKISRRLYFATAEEIAEEMQAKIVEQTRALSHIFNEGPITAAMIENYNDCMALITRGAADERQDDGSYGEDGIEKAVDDLCYKAAMHGLKFVVNPGTQEWVLCPMTDQEKGELAGSLEQEEMARQAEYELRQSQVTASEFSSYEAFKDWEEHNR